MPQTGKTGRSKKTVGTEKSIRVGYSRNDKHFVWSLDRCLWDHYGWMVHCSSAQFFAEHVISKLKAMERMTWQEVLNASGGKSTGHGNNHHFISAAKLPRREKEQFIKLSYMEDYEEVFSLRLSGRERLIGVVDLNVFYVLWFDANHDFF